MSDTPVKPPTEPAPPEKPATPIRTDGVQIGPTPTPPGSRLKKDRR